VGAKSAASRRRGVQPRPPEKLKDVRLLEDDGLAD
jgi:hypothetical protein